MYEHQHFVELRSSHLPYCIKEVEPGYHVVLNREYKPVGMNPYPVPSEWVDYRPHKVKFKGLGPATASRLSYKGSPDTKYIVLYNDGCIPTRDPEYAVAYFKRLEILFKLKVHFPMPEQEHKPAIKRRPALDLTTCVSTPQEGHHIQAARSHTLYGRVARYFSLAGTRLRSFTFL